MAHSISSPCQTLLLSTFSAVCACQCLQKTAKLRHLLAWHERRPRKGLYQATIPCGGRATACGGHDRVARIVIYTLIFGLVSTVFVSSWEIMHPDAGCLKSEIETMEMGVRGMICPSHLSLMT